MKILHISDTHNKHHLLTNLPMADIIVHCGDFTDMGTEKEVLDFLNWFITLPYRYKIFITGNHDLCLWDADNIEDLPNNVFFLQDKSITLEGITLFGLGYNHNEKKISTKADIIITHEPPLMILDESAGRHWGNKAIRDRISSTKPYAHLFGHAHESVGKILISDTLYANGAVLDDQYQLYQTQPLLHNI